MILVAKFLYAIEKKTSGHILIACNLSLDSKIGHWTLEMQWTSGTSLPHMSSQSISIYNIHNMRYYHQLFLLFGSVLHHRAACELLWQISEYTEITDITTRLQSMRAARAVNEYLITGQYRGVPLLNLSLFNISKNHVCSNRLYVKKIKKLKFVLSTQTNIVLSFQNVLKWVLFNCSENC